MDEVYPKTIHIIPNARNKTHIPSLACTYFIYIAVDPEGYRIIHECPDLGTNKMIGKTILHAWDNATGIVCVIKHNVYTNMHLFAYT